MSNLFGKKENDKSLLAICLNEFNLDYLKYGSKKYKKKNIQKILNFKKLRTFTKDRIQYKNLDPWVQSVSINTGKASQKHKIYNLGQRVPDKTIQIWDVLSRKGIKCAIWGTMNSILKKNKNVELYFPDPWNFRNEIYPNKLKYLFFLPHYYAKNYLKYSKIKFFLLSFLFLFGLFIHKSFFYFVKNFFWLIKIASKKGFNNYILFFLYDLVSLNIFSEFNKKKNLKFGLIFLNSIAHFQHNNWDEVKNEKDFFFFADEICEKILILSKKYNSVILFNGFTQKRIETEYILRPKDPLSFLKNLEINFSKVEQDMTNGAFIFFKDFKSKNKALKILKNYKLFGLNVFKVQEFNKNFIFYKLQIKTYKNCINFSSIRNNNFKHYFGYYDKNKKVVFDKKYSRSDYDFFINQVDFIKCTGVHYTEGMMFYKNILINKKKIQNHEIFKLIEKHFN